MQEQTSGALNKRLTLIFAAVSFYVLSQSVSSAAGPGLVQRRWQQSWFCLRMLEFLTYLKPLKSSPFASSQPGPGDATAGFSLPLLSFNLTAIL